MHCSQQAANAAKMFCGKTIATNFLFQLEDMFPCHASWYEQAPGLDWDKQRKLDHYVFT